MNKVKVVSFDLDDTVWECMPVLHRASAVEWTHIEEKYPEVAMHLTARSVGEAMQVAAARTENSQIKHNMTELRKQALHQIVSEFGEGIHEESFVDSVFNAFIEERNNVDDFIFPNIIPTLKMLKDSGYVLVSVTNGNCDVSKVPSLSGLFDHSITAEQVGVSKPHPLVFTRVLELTGVEAHEVLHVGDSIPHDIVGARDFGMATVWVNRHMLDETEHHADAVLNCASELHKILCENVHTQ